MSSSADLLSPTADDLIQAIAAGAPKAGTSMSKFTLSHKAKFRALLIPEKDLLPLLQKALQTALPAGQAASSYALGEPFYTVQVNDAPSDRAEIRADAAVKKAE